MSNAIKILTPAAMSFILGIILTPVFTHFFYKYKMWRKNTRSQSTSVEKFKEIHDDKLELSTPRTGGMIIWVSVITTIFIIWLLNFFIGSNFTQKMYFISREQTLIPLFTLILGSLIGLGDDFIQIFCGNKWTNDPLKLRVIKILIILILGFLISWWFYKKLGMDSVLIPWDGALNLGFLFIPFFILVMLAVFSSSVIDGIDGLSGGVLASIFGAYAIISFYNNQIDLAAFSAVVGGGILAFLWFNIPPARFYMGETGMIGLTATLSVLAFLTDTVLLLPIIAFPLFITSLSNVIQMISKKLRKGKRVFKLAPLHHHFEAIGWPKHKVVMRYWVVGIITSIIGVILAITS